jgi:hypothetical protein
MQEMMLGILITTLKGKALPYTRRLLKEYTYIVCVIKQYLRRGYVYVHMCILS